MFQRVAVLCEITELSCEFVEGAMEHSNALAEFFSLSKTNRDDLAWPSSSSTNPMVVEVVLPLNPETMRPLLGFSHLDPLDAIW
jgi:hypothetical protein